MCQPVDALGKLDQAPDDAGRPDEPGGVGDVALTARRSARRPVRSRKWSWLRSMKLGGASRRVSSSSSSATVLTLELAEELHAGPAGVGVAVHDRQRRRVPMWSHVRLRCLS